MKKLLIIFFILILSSFAQAKDPPKKYLDENYVFKHSKFIKWPETVSYTHLTLPTIAIV